jgi:hypothetical protein
MLTNRPTEIKRQRDKLTEGREGKGREGKGREGKKREGHSKVYIHV